MSRTLKVIVPSYNRSDALDCVNAITIDGICVPASQRDQYVSANPSVEIITHPDSIKGIALKRQWIYEKFGDVLMIDDDVRFFTRTYLPKYRARVRNSKMTAVEAREAMEALYQMAIEIGAYLFGVSITQDVRNYSAQRPFRLTGGINGACLGIRRSPKLFFHPDLVAANDTFISGLNAHFHRYCFIDTRYGFDQGITFGNPGGLSGMRDHASEIEDRKALVRFFGSAIQWRQGNRKRLGEPKSPGNRTLSIPF